MLRVTGLVGMFSTESTGSREKRLILFKWESRGHMHSCVQRSDKDVWM